MLKLSHYTPRRRLWGEEVSVLLILDLSTKWGWVVRVTPRPRFTPVERTPGTHCTGGWVGPRAGQVTETRRKILSPLPGIEPRSPGWELQENEWMMAVRTHVIWEINSRPVGVHSSETWSHPLNMNDKRSYFNVSVPSVITFQRMWNWK
jgi:hypothetical protein